MPKISTEPFLCLRSSCDSAFYPHPFSLSFLFCEGVNEQLTAWGRACRQRRMNKGRKPMTTESFKPVNSKLSMNSVDPIKQVRGELLCHWLPWRPAPHPTPFLSLGFCNSCWHRPHTPPEKTAWCSLVVGNKGQRDFQLIPEMYFFI